MRDKVLLKMNKKLSLTKRKNIFNNGKKILDKSINYIEKFIQ